MNVKPLVALIMCFPLVVHAMVDLSLADGESAAVRVSIKDPTRIRVEGKQITDLVGAEINSEENPGGRLRVTANDRGDVFIQPTDPAMEATSLFITTETATYTLVLAPASIPADTIRIVPQAVTSTGARSDLMTGADKRRLPNHEKAIVMLMRSIASDDLPPYLQVIERNIPVALWEGTNFTLIREYQGHPRWRVEAYLLTNRSSSSMRIDEREFVRKGVVAVALEQADLAPGQSVVVRVAYDDGVL